MLYLFSLSHNGMDINLAPGPSPGYHRGRATRYSGRYTRRWVSGRTWRIPANLNFDHRGLFASRRIRTAPWYNRAWNGLHRRVQSWSKTFLHFTLQLFQNLNSSLSFSSIQRLRNWNSTAVLRNSIFQNSGRPI